MTIAACRPLADAARALCDGADEALVAIASDVSHPTAIGVITPRDLLSGILQREGNLSGVTVLDILSQNPLMLNRDDDIEQAASKLVARGLEHAAVLGSGGALWGAISLLELLTYINASLRAGSMGYPARPL